VLAKCPKSDIMNMEKAEHHKEEDLEKIMLMLSEQDKQADKKAVVANEIMRLINKLLKD
jgi:hypothetical protein